MEISVRDRCFSPLSLLFINFEYLPYASSKYMHEVPNTRMKILRCFERRSSLGYNVMKLHRTKNTTMTQKHKESFM